MSLHSMEQGMIQVIVKDTTPKKTSHSKAQMPTKKQTNCVELCKKA